MQAERRLEGGAGEPLGHQGDAHRREGMFFPAQEQPIQFELVLNLKTAKSNPRRGYAFAGLAFAYMVDERYSEALQAAQQVTREMPRWVTGWAAFTIAAAYTEQMDSAREAAKMILTLLPLRTNAAIGGFRDKSVRDRVQNDHHVPLRRDPRCRRARVLSVDGSR